MKAERLWYSSIVAVLAGLVFSVQAVEPVADYLFQNDMASEVAGHRI